MNIGSLLPRHARYRPENLAFVVGKERLNFFELNERVNRLANALLGIRKQQKTGKCLGESNQELRSAPLSNGKRSSNKLGSRKHSSRFER